MAIEIPDYDVEQSLAERVEIRRYEPMLLAEVQVDGDRGKAVSRAFRILADYIFGNNAPRAKIAMTAPVLQRDAMMGARISTTKPVGQVTAADGSWRVSFIMPAKYTEETLPAPVDERVTIRRGEPYRAVVLRFSGRHSDANFKRHLQLLDASVEQHSLATTGPAMLAYYDAPFKPFFLRRNEVMYRLSE